MSPNRTVVVAGYGARTSLGMNALASAAAVRAGIAGFAQHPFVVDTAGKRMVVSRAPYLSLALTGAGRLAELAAPAACEAVRPLRMIRERLSVPVFIGHAPARPGGASDVEQIADRVIAAIHDVADARRVVMIATGHAAGAMAIQVAWQAVRAGDAEFALAGGVDSYMDADTLEWLEGNEQVHSAGSENNPYGFIPGEGSGFVLLASADALHRLGLTASLELATAASARETHLIKTDSVCTGDGMTALFRSLRGEPALRRADHLFCDMNGEPYRAEEFGFASIRVADLFADPSSFTAPADCWGDVGAASGPLFVMLADAAIRKRYAPGPVIAAFTSSESGERCGFVVHAARREERV